MTELEWEPDYMPSALALCIQEHLYRSRQWLQGKTPAKRRRDTSICWRGMRTGWGDDNSVVRRLANVRRRRSGCMLVDKELHDMELQLLEELQEAEEYERMYQEQWLDDEVLEDRESEPRPYTENPDWYDAYYDPYDLIDLEQMWPSTLERPF